MNSLEKAPLSKFLDYLMKTRKRFNVTRGSAGDEGIRAWTGVGDCTPELPTIFQTSNDLFAAGAIWSGPVAAGSVCELHDHWAGHGDVIYVVCGL